MASLVNDRLRLVDIGGFLQAARRYLICPGEPESDRITDREHEVGEGVGPRGHGYFGLDNVYKPDDQPTGNGVEQSNLENVAATQFGKQSHSRILTQQPLPPIQAGADPGQRSANGEGARHGNRDM